MRSFDELSGRVRIRRYFETVLLHDNLSHAYILSGEKGLGKKSIAEALSLSLFCEKDILHPCKACPSCKKVMAGTHKDIRYIKTDKSSISVAQIRDLVEDARIRPYAGRYKLYIIEEAQKMTIEAQNALLKTLEEPPAYMIVLLLTSNEESLLATIQSRCVNLSLPYMASDRLKALLEKEYAIADASAAIAYARGNIGKAIGFISDDSVKQGYMENIRILRHVAYAKESEFFDLVKELTTKIKDMEAFLDFTQMWYRDILIQKASDNQADIIFTEEYRTIAELARAYTYMQIGKILDRIDLTRERLRANVNKDNAIWLFLNEMRLL